MRSDSAQTHEACQQLHSLAAGAEPGMGATVAVLTLTGGDISKVTCAYSHAPEKDLRLIVTTDALLIECIEPNHDGGETTSRAWPWSSVSRVDVEPHLDLFRSGPAADPGAMTWHPVCSIHMEDGEVVEYGRGATAEIGYREREAHDASVEKLTREVLSHL